MKRTSHTFYPAGVTPLVLLAVLPFNPHIAVAASDSTQQDNTLVVTGQRVSDQTNNGQDPIPAFLDGDIANGGRLGVLGEQKAMDVPFSVAWSNSGLMNS